MTKLRKSNGGWAALIRDINALVLFANGFGDLILPGLEEKTKMCSKWHALTSGLDYLATGTQMLTELFNRAGSRLDHQYLTSTGLRWHQENILYGGCRDKHDCRCDRLQRIVSKYSCGSITIPGALQESGAVIFGRSQWGNPFSRPCNETPQFSGLYSQPNSTMVQSDLEVANSDERLSESLSHNQSQTAIGSSVGSSSTGTTAMTEITSPETQQESSTLALDNAKRKHYCSANVEEGNVIGQKIDRADDVPKKAGDTTTRTTEAPPRKRNKSASSHPGSQMPSGCSLAAKSQTGHPPRRDRHIPTSPTTLLRHPVPCQSDDSKNPYDPTIIQYSDITLTRSQPTKTQPQRSIRRVGASINGHHHGTTERLTQ